MNFLCQGFRKLSYYRQTDTRHKNYKTRRFANGQQLCEKIAIRKRRRRFAHHLKERQVSDEAVVEVDIRREPGVVVERSDYFAVVLVSDDVEAHQFPELITTAAESTAEQVDAHDAEDEPEDEADEQNVEDGWNCLDQRVHYHLCAGQVQLTATDISSL